MTITKKNNRVLLVGGPDVDARIDLMHRLSEFERVAVGSNGELADHFKQAGFDYYEYPLNRGTNPIADFSTLIRLVGLFRRLHPDIVHTFDTKPGVWGRIAAKLAGAPVIIGTLPGLGSLYTNNSLSTRLIRSIYQAIQKLACTQSDVTIFQNQDDLHQFVSTGIVQQSKAVIIPGSGVETNIYDQNRFSESDRVQIRVELGIPQDALVVTMIARLIRSKGVLEFGLAADILREQGPDIKFLLVGPADIDSVYGLTSDERLSLTKAVIWPGPRKDVPKILAASDIFVLPSYYREGMPRVLLEAASMGLPLVTTDTPGCKEVVTNDQNGYLVPVRDSEALAQAIFRLSSDANLRERFGKASRQRAVTRFDLSIIADQIKSLYMKLLAEKGLILPGGLS